MAAERDPAVRIVDYDPGWPEEAARELRRVGEALGGVAVRLDHVGSTAVPGLAAKPIVDLEVSVVALEPQAAYVEPLEAIGYRFVPFATAPEYHSTSASRRSGRGRTICTSAWPAASKSGATSRSATSSAPIRTKRRAMRR